MLLQLRLLDVLTWGAHNITYIIQDCVSTYSRALTTASSVFVRVYQLGSNSMDIHETLHCNLLEKPVKTFKFSSKPVIGSCNFPKPF
jgi:hypothetical protein